MITKARIKKLPVWVQEHISALELELLKTKQALTQAKGEWEPTNFARRALSYGGVGSQKRIYIPETSTVHFHFGEEVLDFKFETGNSDPPRVRVLSNDGRIFIVPHTSNVIHLIPSQ